MLQLKELKLLIVEDEKKLANLLKSAIGEYFQRCEVAYDGEEGLLRYKSFRPDIIITDIMIPKKTGLEMAKEIKKLADIPIIVLSAYSDKDKLLDAIDTGVVKYFIKPFDPDELLEYLKTLAKKIVKQKVVKLVDGFSYHDKLCHDKKVVALTKKESLFFEKLISRKGDIMTKEEIKEFLWGSSEVSDERLRTFIKRVRAKTSKELIKSISGRGYFVGVVDG